MYQHQIDRGNQPRRKFGHWIAAALLEPEQIEELEVEF